MQPAWQLVERRLARVCLDGNVLLQPLQVALLKNRIAIAARQAAAAVVPFATTLASSTKGSALPSAQLALIPRGVATLIRNA
jgi:hypothetical protein